MTLRVAPLRTLVCVTGLLLAMPVVVRGDDVELTWGGIRPLEIDLTSQGVSPFLKWDEKQEAKELPPAPAPTRKEHPSTQKNDNNVAPRHDRQRTVSEVALDHDPAERLAANRVQLRESLGRDGQHSIEERDSLTSEVLSVMQWTIVTLILGGVATAVLKQYQNRSPSAGGGRKIRVLETLPLGRHQGLKLVEVGGERFLVASDQSGIKSVTMLPTWPHLEEGETRESQPIADAPLHLFSGEFSSPPQTDEEAESEIDAVA